MKNDAINPSNDDRPDSDLTRSDENEVRDNLEADTEARVASGSEADAVGSEEENIRLTDGDAIFFGKTIRFPQSTPSRSIPRLGADRKEAEDASTDKNDAESDGPSFLSFFEETTDDVDDETLPADDGENPPIGSSTPKEDRRQDPVSEKESQTFRCRFESFFQNEGEESEDFFSDEDSSEDGETAGESDDDTDEEEEDGGLSYDEMIRRDEEAAATENLDAVIRQNDADALYALGEKFERDTDETDLGAASGEEVEINPTTILEAMIFVGNRENRPLPPSKASALMRNVTEAETRESVAELNRRYATTGAPFQITETDEGFIMVLRPELEDVRDRFFNKVKEVKLSQKAIDIIALVAYRQPISAAEIQEVRPQSGGILNLLLKRGLIAREKRTTERESVYYYRTTPRLLKLLGVDHLDDLPVVDEVDYR